MESRRNIRFTATERANDAPVCHCTDVSPRNLKQAAAETNLHLKSPLREVTLHLEASNSFLPDVVLITIHQRRPMLQMYILHQRAYDAVLGAQHY